MAVLAAFLDSLTIIAMHCLMLKQAFTLKLIKIGQQFTLPVQKVSSFCSAVFCHNSMQTLKRPLLRKTIRSYTDSSRYLDIMMH